MNPLRLLITLFIVIADGWTAPAAPQSNKFDWTQIDTGRLWVALHRNYGGIKFSAVRFHLGYYRLNLVDMKSYRDRSLGKSRAIRDEREFSKSVLDVGIKAIYETWANPTEIVAVAPAGWSTSLRRIEHSGLLKISGEQLSEFDDRPSLSAIICLHSPAPEYRNFEYQVPTFYKSADFEHSSLAEKCKDAVQAGPRIIEDPKVSAEQSGISDAEVNIRPQSRVIFALDNPGREFPPGNPNVRLRDNARNGYLIVTEEPVHLVDVQNVLLSRGFYGADSKRWWAVNMAGGGPAGLVIRTDPYKSPEVIGNHSGVIGSAFVVLKRIP